MTRDELAALEHENWIAYLTGVVSCTDRATVTRAGGVVAILSGLPFDWFNQVLIEREEATAAGVLAGVAQAREWGGPFVVRLRDGIDDRFIPTLSQAGLAPEGAETSTPGMVAYPIDFDAIAEPAVPELEIRRVTDAAGIDAHREAVTAGFGSHPAVADGTACPGLLDRPECVVYVGYVFGDPVVSGLGWRTGRTIGVYSIATIASARRRGYGGGDDGARRRRRRGRRLRRRGAPGERDGPPDLRAPGLPNGRQIHRLPRGGWGLAGRNVPSVVHTISREMKP